MTQNSQLIATLLKAAKLEQQQVLLCNSSMDKDEESLMGILSFEYRRNYNGVIREILFGSDFSDVERSCDPGFIIEKVFERAYNSQQRKEIMIESIKLIRKYKQARLNHQNISEVFPMDAVPPFKKDYSKVDTDENSDRDQESVVDPWALDFENKLRRRELKKHHFEVKSKEILKKVRHIQALQRHVSDRKKAEFELLGKVPSLASTNLSPQVSGSPNTKLSLPPLSKAVSLKHIGSHQTSQVFMTEAKQANAEGGSIYEKYYCDLKGNLKNMAGQQKRSKHLLIDGLQGGIDLMCAQIGMSDSVNRLSKDTQPKTVDPQSQIDLRVGALVGKEKQKFGMLETRFDHKIGSFLEVNLPRLKKVREKIANQRSMITLSQPLNRRKLL